MIAKDIKGEARKKLALNMHQAIIVYTVELTIFITLIALVVMSCVTLGSAISNVAAIVMICYGSILLIIAFVGAGMVNFAMTDFYLVSYRCQPYNIRRLGETIARSNITKVLLMSLKRTVIAFLLLLCLIVPGVIYLIRTSMASFLLIANPKMKPSMALTASGKVMSGKTGMYFSLCMSLFGWYVLGVATLGLGFIFIAPYTGLVKTVFYKRNLQGDKGTYTISPQTLMSVPNTTSAPGQTRQPTPGQMPQQKAAPAQSMPAGPAPVDALADDDVMDMNAAIQDFGGTGVDAIPEVPLTPPGKKQEKPDKRGKTKLTREERRMAKEVSHEESRKIDGTGLVETERILSTQEISDSDSIQRMEIERMYSNSERQRPKVNYFDTNSPVGNGADDFVDDFGVTPITDDMEEAPVVEPIAEDPIEPPVMEPVAEPIAQDAFVEQAEPVAQGEEPIISDSEFDEFLRNFDLGGDGDIEQPEVDIEQTEVDNAEDPLKDEQNTDTIPTATDRRKEAEARIQHDRQAAADRLAHARQQRTISNDISERAERIRREREERLKNQNPKD